MTIAVKHNNSAAGLAWQIMEHYTDTYVLEGLIEPGSHDKAMPRKGSKDEKNPFDDFQYIKIFPNPVDDIAILEFVGYESTLTLKLIDSEGKIVMNKTIAGKDLQNILRFDNYSAGLYSLVINDNTGVIYNEKLIIKH